MALQKNIADMKILLVDDQPIILEMLGDVLRHLGLQDIRTATSAEHALAMIEGMAFDLVLVDIEMDGMNGLELIKRIRCGQSGLSPSTLIMVVTSHTDSKVLGTAIALDVNGIVAKPAKPALLLKNISDAINTDFVPRPSIAYDVITTDVVSSAVQAELDEAEVALCPIDKLVPGMVLAEQVRMTGGELLLDKGLMLTDTAIARLTELRALLAGDSFRVVHASD